MYPEEDASQAEPLTGLDQREHAAIQRRARGQTIAERSYGKVPVPWKDVKQSHFFPIEILL